MCVNVDQFFYKAVEGDKDAMGKLLNAMLPSVQHFWRNKKFNDGDFEDIYHEVSIGIIISLKRFNPKVCPAPFPYLKKIAERVIQRKIERSPVRNNLDINSQFYTEESGALQNQNLHFTLEEQLVIKMDNQDTINKIIKFVSTLRKIEQQVFWVCYEENMSLVEFAKRSGIRYNTCFKIKKRVFEKIRKNFPEF